MALDLKLDAFRVIKVALFLFAVEALCWLFGTISILGGNPYRLYDRSKLANEIKSSLEVERTAPSTGWGGGPPRAQPVFATKLCGSAWGGSFTLADDVDNDQTWPYLASISLRCSIDNFGVDGFGFDQTLLLFQSSAPRHSLVILGMSPPMISVGGASSWTFLALKDSLPQWKMTKPIFRIENRELRLYPRPEPTVDAILNHYRNDDFAQGWTAFRFPFVLSVAKALYRNRASPNLLRFGPTENLPQLKAQRDVAVATIAAMAKAAAENDDRFVVLLIPRPEDAERPDAVFSSMLSELSAQHAGCTIDAWPEIHRAASRLAAPGEIMTASKHFSPVGNAAIANALVRGLTDCGIKP